jgi:hypothetical protein
LIGEPARWFRSKSERSNSGQTTIAQVASLTPAPRRRLWLPRESASEALAPTAMKAEATGVPEPTSGTTVREPTRRLLVGDCSSRHQLL